jgi:hypothetical protein
MAPNRNARSGSRESLREDHSTTLPVNCSAKFGIAKGTGNLPSLFSREAILWPRKID